MNQKSEKEIPEIIFQEYTNVRSISHDKIREEYENPNGRLHGVRNDALSLTKETKFFVGETGEKERIIECLFHINEEEGKIHVLTFHYKNGGSVFSNL